MSPRERMRTIIGFTSLLSLLLLTFWLTATARDVSARGGGEPAQLIYMPVISGRNLLDLTLLTDEIDSPTAIVSAGASRLLVSTLDGYVRVISGTNTVLSTPFLDLAAEVSGGEESGIFDLAVDPDFANNGYVYISFLNGSGTSIIARFQTSDDDPNVADPASRTEILTVAQPGPQHNGGALAFGPDGYLYVSLGDGQCCSDPLNNAQDLGVLLGKILRLDVSTVPYSIPPDNPYITTPGARGEIWASGLRNPWRMGFDPDTGDLFIADVGELLWEEVNFQPAGAPGGANYGWPCYEATAPNNLVNCPEPDALTFPAIAYNRDLIPCAAVIGGAVYRGSLYPELDGKYFYADWCAGSFWIAERAAEDAWTSQFVGQFNFSPNGFGHDADGELLVVGFPNRIYRLGLTDRP